MATIAGAGLAGGVASAGELFGLGRIRWGELIEVDCYEKD